MARPEKLPVRSMLKSRSPTSPSRPGPATALACAIAAVLLTSGGADGPEVVNYREPLREFRQVRVGGWAVSVEKSLQAGSPDVARRALARLAARRAKVLAAVPAPARERLARVPFFLMHGPEARGGGRDNGLEYFQKDAPEHHPELDPRWKDAIVVYSARNYLDISELWATKALFHEFAHAYHLEQWTEDRPEIVRAWEHARDAGLYRDVPDLEEPKVHATAYALTNPLEYFAELSCMHFVGCNYRPANRAELKRYDPDGYAMIREAWRLTR